MSKEKQTTELYANIQKRAKEKKISIKQLAKDVGVSPMTLAYWRIAVPMSVQTYLKIEEALK